MSLIKSCIPSGSKIGYVKSEVYSCTFIEGVKKSL
jgi:hypothetical protein